MSGNEFPVSDGAALLLRIGQAAPRAQPVEPIETPQRTVDIAAVMRSIARAMERG